RVNPRLKNTTSTTNTSMGSRKRNFMASPGFTRRVGCGDRSRRPFALAFSHTYPVALVTERGETADCHEQAAGPDPLHERFVVQAYRPGTVVQGAAQRHINITGQGVVNRRLRGAIAGCRIQPLGRIQFVDLPALA